MESLIINDPKVNDFTAAKNAAIEAAKTKLNDKEPVLWAWCDTTVDRHNPNAECCGSDKESGWEVYARVRGSVLKVLINEGVYEFFFGPSFA